MLALTLAIGCAAFLALGSALETLRLGDPLAASLGTRVQLVRLISLILGATLAAIATSVVGPISFVALVSGPIAARLFPSSSLLPSLLIGAGILVVSDLVAQTAPGISPVSTGIVTGIVGAPVLIFLLMSRQRGASR